MGSQCYFPEDIIEDILGRLPGRSLVRFKCVSKAWGYIISSFKFKPRALLCSEHYCQFFHSINDDDSVFEELPTPWQSPTLYPRFKGLVNGLLLIQNGNSFFLWNPFTGYFNNVLNGWYLGDSIGFCYDPSTDDYKLVAFGSKFIVMSLKTKCWKRVRFSSYDIKFALDGPVVEGRLHWRVVYKKEDSVSEILCFDPTTDELTVLPTRKPKHGNTDLLVSGLGVLKGNLCMFCNCCQYCCYMHSHFEVTVMKEYGVVESWTTLFVISNLFVTPLSFTRDGELLMAILDGKIVAYNPTSSSYRKIDFLSTNLRPEPEGFSNFVATYEPTLVSPFPIKQKRKMKKKNIEWDSADEEENEVQEINTKEEQAGKQEIATSMMAESDQEEDDRTCEDDDMEAILTLNRLRKSRKPVPGQA